MTVSMYYSNPVSLHYSRGVGFSLSYTKKFGGRIKDVLQTQEISVSLEV